MKRILWWFVDTVAHFLYQPIEEVPVHLIPSSWVDWVCDRFDRHLGGAR